MGIAWRKGYCRQEVDSEGYQLEYYPDVPIEQYGEIVRDKDFILKVGNEEITRRDRLTAEREAEITRLNHTLREKDRELTELRWFEGRVKRTMPYKAYKIMKSILQGGH